MSTFEDAIRIALALPGTAARELDVRVAGKAFIHVYPEKVDPKRPRVPNFGVLVVHVPDLRTKEALIASDPDTYFTTSHYDGYAMVLARLARLNETLLAELVAEAWRCRAPRDLPAD